jgi:hypothetical protein
MNKNSSIYASSTMAVSYIVALSLLFIVLDPNQEDDWLVTFGVMIVGLFFLAFGLYLRHKYENL